MANVPKISPGSGRMVENGSEGERETHVRCRWSSVRKQHKLTGNHCDWPCPVNVNDTCTLDLCPRPYCLE